MLNPGGCSSRLRGYPFLGGRHALLRGGSVWDAEMVLGARACFVERTILYHPKNKRFGKPYVIAVDRCFPKARKKQLGWVTT